MCDLPEDWPWSSYQAIAGQVTPPPWLHRKWLPSQFGNRPQAAVQAYVEHVRAGLGLPSVWEQLQGQLYLGDAEFIESMGDKIATKLSVDTEITRLQRRAKAPPLGSFVEMTNQKAAMVQAHATGC